MNTTTRIAAVALSFFAAGASMAQGPLDEPVAYKASTTSSVTRAQVQVELAQAKGHGNAIRSDVENIVAPSQSTLTRAEVRAETLRAIESGELQALNRDHNGFYGAGQVQRTPVTTLQMAKAAK